MAFGASWVGGRLAIGTVLAILVLLPQDAMAQRNKTEEPRTGCRVFQDYADLQVREMLTTIRDKAADTLDQTFAFEALNCAKRAAVRELAVRSALNAAHNPAIQSVAMLNTLMLRDVLVIEFPAGAEVDADTAAFIRDAGGSIALTLSKHDRTTKQICLFNDCRSDIMDISGTRVTIAYDARRPRGASYKGEFILVEGGKLAGKFYGTGLPSGTKAEIKIY